MKHKYNVMLFVKLLNCDDVLSVKEEGVDAFSARHAINICYNEVRGKYYGEIVVLLGAKAVACNGN